MEVPYLLLLALTVFMVAKGVTEMANWIANKIRNHRPSKRARIEAELERTRAELRATIFNLASQLGAEAHEARKALIQQSYLASRDDNPHGR